MLLRECRSVKSSECVEQSHATESAEQLLHNAFTCADNLVKHAEEAIVHFESQKLEDVKTGIYYVVMYTVRAARIELLELIFFVPNSQL